MLSARVSNGGVDSKSRQVRGTCGYAIRSLEARQPGINFVVSLFLLYGEHTLRTGKAWQKWRREFYAGMSHVDDQMWRVEGPMSAVTDKKYPKPSINFTKKKVSRTFNDCS